MPAKGIEIVQRPRLRENSGSMEFAETKEVSRRSPRELKFDRYTLRLEDLAKSFKWRAYVIFAYAIFAFGVYRFQYSHVSHRNQSAWKKEGSRKTVELSKRLSTRPTTSMRQIIQTLSTLSVSIVILVTRTHKRVTHQTQQKIPRPYFFTVNIFYG